MSAELAPSGVNIRIVKFFSKAKEETLKEPETVPVADGKGGYVMTATGVTRYRKTGKMITQDWVAYAPPGAMDRSVTNEPISEIQKIMPPQGTFNPAADAQYAVAQYILKHYEAWKAGNELPLDGTPLAAWNALSHEEVEAFKKAGIRTVEEIRDMGDALLSKIAVPRLREKKAMAERFLVAADQNRAASEHQELLERIAALEEQNRELTAANVPHKGKKAA